MVGSGYTKLLSPDGKCQFKLSFVPTHLEDFFSPTLAYIDEEIIACPSQSFNSKYCWQYNVIDNNWIAITTVPSNRYGYPGIAHNDKIFLLDHFDPDVYDPKNNAWSKWPKPSKEINYYLCMISWKDSILVFSGLSSEHSVQIFNTTSYSWSVLKSGVPPFKLSALTCILLPKNQVLLVGPRYDVNSSALFDIQTNSWEKLKDSKYDRYGSTLVNLSGRIFLIGGMNEAITEEFHLDTKTWTEVDSRKIYLPYLSSALALPAEMFPHLLGGCEGIM